LPQTLLRTSAQGKVNFIVKFSATIALLKKDLLLEMRQQQNLYGILIYALSTIFILYLAAGQPDATQWNALFWITQLFIVVNAVIKSFVGEPKGRSAYYFSLVHPLEYLFSKMMLNTLYMLLLGIVAMGCFQFLLGNPVVNYWAFMGIVLLGGIGLSLVFTMLSAIAAKAKQQASLVAILGFPVIIPQLVLLVRLSKYAFGEVFKEGVPLQMVGLLSGLDALVIIMAAVLFPYLWKD
jgi:heme exporter protein B